MVAITSLATRLALPQGRTGSRVPGSAFVPLRPHPGHRTLRRCAAAAQSTAVIADEQTAASASPSDDDEFVEGDFCVLPELDVSYARVPDDPAERFQDVFKGAAIFILPFAGPSTAFLLWQYILQLVHSVLGEEKSLLELTQMTLNPTTNGIVVASLATALGTLTSITAWTLRQRQLDVRNCLNKEACDLSLLRSCITAYLATPEAQGTRKTDPTLHAQTLALLRQYTARIAAETSKRADLRSLECQDLGSSELAGIARALYAPGVPEGLRQGAAVHVARLNDSRSLRLATLSTAFPPLHWLILALLACSIAVCFLIEVDQSEGRFLSERPEDSLRLRVIFSMLVGTFSGLSALCADLNDPYRGSFSIVGSTQQLLALVRGLDDELEGALERLNPALSRGDVERAIKAADKNGDGAIDYDEFAEWVRLRCSGRQRC